MHFFVYDLLKIIVLILAVAFFGALTPFCSCSSVPLFLGFVKARFPIGVAFAFLITSPLVNEIAVVLIGVSFGWKIAAGYTLAGVVMGVTGGVVLTWLHAERWLRPESELDAEEPDQGPATWGGRLREAAGDRLHICRKIFHYLVIALLLGAGLHGFVPEDFFGKMPAGTTIIGWIFNAAD